MSAPPVLATWICQVAAVPVGTSGLTAVLVTVQVATSTLEEEVLDTGMPVGV